jgi:oligopeptide transport system substrate-binding protein
MKKLLAGALSVVTALSLTACRAHAKTSFTYAMDSDMTSLDSAAFADGGSIEVLKTTSEGLMTYDQKGKMIYGIAKSVDVSKDEKTYTFHLRNTKWSNGTAVTADDFVYGFQRIFAIAGDYIYMYGSGGANIVNADRLMKKAGHLTQKQLNTLGIQAKDAKTVVIKLTRPVPYFKQLMTFTCFFPINRKFATKAGKNYGKSAKYFLSDGPYSVSSWTKSTRIDFVKNTDYYDQKNVHLDHLTFTLAQKAQTAAASYESGNVDMFNVTIATLKRYQNKTGYYSYRTGYEYYLLPNFRNKILANKNIRLAISYALNRRDFVKNILKDGSKAATGFVPDGVATSSSNVDFRKEAGDYSNLTYNHAKAQQALNKGLKELGKSSVTIHVLYGTDETLMNQFATYVQNSLSKLKGIKVQVVATTRQDRVNSRQSSGDFELSCTRWSPDYPDPTTYLNLLAKGNHANYGKYESAKYNAYMNTAGSTTDINKRWNTLISAEKVAMNDLAVIPVFNQGGAAVINPHFKGIYSKPIVELIFRYAQKK